MDERGTRSPSERPIERGRPLVFDPRAVWHVVAVLIVVGLLWALRDLIAPFLFAAALTFIGAPMVSRLRRRGLSRYLGSFLFLVLIGMLLAALLLLVVPRLIAQLDDLITRFPMILQRLSRFLAEELGVNVAENLDELTRRLQGSFAESARGIAGGAARGLASVVTVTALVVLVPLLTFFALAELPAFAHFVHQALPERVRDETTRYGRLIHDALANMLRGQLIVASIMAAIYVVGLSLVGVPLPVAIGIISGLAYFIPFATTVVCISLSTVFVLLEPEGPLWFPILGAAAVAVAVQALESWLLTPRIVGAKAQLSPLVVVIAATIGAELAGFTGVLFSFPVATAIGVVVRDRYAHVVETPALEAATVDLPEERRDAPREEP